MRFMIRIALLLFPLSVFSQTELYNFYKLDTYNGLSHNQVSAIIKDHDGFLWVGTLSGLNRYDGNSCLVFRKNYSDSTSVRDNSILSLYELPDGRMWVSTSAGACIYNSYNEKFDPDYNGYLRSLGLPAAPIFNIVKGNNKRYWFVYNNLDLYLYSAAEKKVVKFRQNPTGNYTEILSSIKESGDGKIWLLYQSIFAAV